MKTLDSYYSYSIVQIAKSLEINAQLILEAVNKTESVFENQLSSEVCLSIEKDIHNWRLVKEDIYNASNVLQRISKDLQYLHKTLSSIGH